MWRYFKLSSAVLCLILFMCYTSFAGGLSTQFVEVRLKGLRPGKSCSVKDKSGRELIIENTTDSKVVDIAVKAEKPVGYNLVPGYKPIPDLSWVVIDKDYFKDVGPGQSAKTDISIKIPNDRKYAGKKYQVYLYSHTAGKETMRMGLMSRLLLEVESVSK